MTRLGFATPTGVVLGLATSSLWLVVTPLTYSPWDRLRTHFTAIAVTLFDAYIPAPTASPKADRRRQTLRAAHVTTPYRLYAAQTLLLACVVALTSSSLILIAGVSLTHTPLTLPIPQSLPTTRLLHDGTHSLPSLSPLLLVCLTSCGTGLLLGGATYYLRWMLPRVAATVRTYRINRGLPRVIAFLYALSRKGIPMAVILEILANNTDAYGAAADDIAVAVREMDVYGADLHTALQRMARRTPSTEFRDFTDNFVHVLQSGQNVSGFLKNQYDRYQSKQQTSEQQFVEMLGALAEGYVALGVVGPLLIISSLVIIGLFQLGAILHLTQVLVYLGLPLLNLGFIIGFHTVLHSPHRTIAADPQSMPFSGFQDLRTTTTPTTSARELRIAPTIYERLRVYKHFETLWERLTNPLQTVSETPRYSLIVTVPLAAGWVGVHVAPLLTRSPTSLTTLLATADDPVIHATIGVTGSFAAVYAVQQRREAAIEAAIPEFLNRIASVNEAGMTIVESLNEITYSDLGPLATELDRTRADLTWGADAATALTNLEARTQVPAMTRVLTLIRAALHASGYIAPVVWIAADEADRARHLATQRAKEMLTYVVIIYLSFGVFLGILAAILHILMPHIPTTMAATSTTAFTLTPRTKHAYTLLLFHTAAIQAVAAGLIAGQLGDGSIQAGTKHTTILLTGTYLVFVLLT